MKEKNVPNVRKVRKDAREPHTQKPETESTPVNMGPSCGAIVRLEDRPSIGQ